MNWKPVFHAIAWLLGVVAMLMGGCGLFSWLSDEPSAAWQALAGAGGGTLAVSVGLWLVTRNRRELSRRDGLGVVAFGWLLASVAAAVPFVLAGVISSPVAALFEAVSGLTTTGATVIPVLEQVPKGLLLWRATTHLLGGMGVLVLVVAILPFAGAGGMQLYRAEMPGPSKDRIQPRMAATAKVLWGVYLLLTVVLLGLLRLGGLNWFDAVCHSFSTLATGGFSTRTTSIAAFQSSYIETVLTVFMLLGGINFALHFRGLRGDWLAWWRDPEFRFFIGVFLVCSFIGTGVVQASPDWAAASWRAAFRQVSFTCASMMTTTGFSIQDYGVWPLVLKPMLILLMFLGGCAGSTAGGLKVSRVQVLWKALIREVRLVMQPQAVLRVKVGQKYIGNDVLRAMLSFVLLYLLVLLAGFLALIPFVPDMITAGSAAIACIANVGPGFGAVGPGGTYAAIPPAGQGVLMVLMLAGRLELYTLLAIFMPAFWRK